MPSIADLTTQLFSASVTATSVTDQNQVTSPGAGVDIARTAALPAGAYNVEVTSFISGTTAPADIPNMRLVIGATPVGRILNPIAGTTGAADLGKASYRVQITNPTSVGVIAVAAGTASSVYTALIVATKVA